MKRHSRKPIPDLSGQCHRPEVRLLNRIERQLGAATRMEVQFCAHRYPVAKWHFEDAVGFGETDAEPEVYRYRELGLALEVEGLPLLLWICDELNMAQPAACVCPAYGAAWTPAQAARLQLLFGRRLVEDEACCWIEVPLASLSLWVDGRQFSAF